MLPEPLVPLEEGLFELPEPEGEALLPEVLSVEGALDGDVPLPEVPPVPELLPLPEVPVEDELDGDVPLLDGDVPLSEVLPPDAAPPEGEL